MNIKEPTNLEIEILNFQTKVQSMVDNSIACYESFLLDEHATKLLLERIGEIHNKQGPLNEHKADT